MGNLFELRVPLFRPMWRRVVLVIALFGWGLMEYVNQNPLWAMVFFAVGVMASYQYFFAWKDPVEESDDGDGDTGGDDAKA